jgi:hypothetical protein
MGFPGPGGAEKNCHASLAHEFHRRELQNDRFFEPRLGAKSALSKVLVVLGKPASRMRRSSARAARVVAAG